MKIFAKIIGALILLGIMFVISTSVGFSIGQLFFNTEGLVGVGGVANEANIMGFIIGMALFLITATWVLLVMFRRR